jgi:hypothetical protein
MISYKVHDVEHRYCGWCKIFLQEEECQVWNDPRGVKTGR